LGYYIIPFGIIYADNQLITIFAGDVRVAPVNVGNSTYWKYKHSMKDHTSMSLSAGLGNVRSVITTGQNNQPELVQANDYFPFGMSYSTAPNGNKFKYNSKEEQEMPGKWMDYGARFYDATLGKWHVVDPLGEKYYPISPYAYVANNPVVRTDPDGRLSTDFRDKLDKRVKQVDDGSNAVFKQTGDGSGLHYVFDGFNESQGGENKIVMSTAIQEQQILNNENSSLEENALGLDETHCNQSTQNVLKTVSSIFNNVRWSNSSGQYFMQT
jgi:RHS repeat-associated protein